jgi:hypothetical protein
MDLQTKVGPQDVGLSVGIVVVAAGEGIAVGVLMAVVRVVAKGGANTASRVILMVASPVRRIVGTNYGTMA